MVANTDSSGDFLDMVQINNEHIAILIEDNDQTYIVFCAWRIPRIDGIYYSADISITSVAKYYLPDMASIYVTRGNTGTLKFEQLKINYLYFKTFESVTEETIPSFSNITTDYLLEDSTDGDMEYKENTGITMTPNPTTIEEKDLVGKHFI
jgi:hypothetical protein